MPAHDVIDVWQVGARDRGAGRARLRAILASYVGGDPATLLFEPGVHGKPALVGHELEFSFSRSGPHVLVAVSPDRPVGVDVERVKPGRAVDRIARRRFAPAEKAALARLDESDRVAAFHRCWTGKEAYAKGRGAGLSMGLATFSVAGLIDGLPRCSVGTWEVQQLPAPAGHAAALAAPGLGRGTRVRVREDHDG
jgi:4'-phosphopantetheinyl transferase